MCGTVKLDASVQTGETCKAKQNTATKMLRVNLLQKTKWTKMMSGSHYVHKATILQLDYRVI